LTADVADLRGWKRNMSTLIHEDLSKSVIGCAMTVLNELKPGLDEKLYENALVIELKKKGHEVEQQRSFPVYYDEAHIGPLIPDLIVDNRVIVDPKVVVAFNENHIAQMIGYLAITGMHLALLLNFKQAKLSWKRVVKESSPVLSASIREISGQKLMVEDR
jgi:GxxExxY protein